MSSTLDLKLDEWQKKVLSQKGNICLRSGRQVGKSTVISIKAAEYAVNNKKKTVLVVAAVERQAYHLFEMTLNYLTDNYKSHIKMGKNRPTKSKIQLKNGSVIMCLPTGVSGLGIRGYTIDLLIADEAAFIPEEVWTAITPMLSVTKGDIILLSTPHGKEGFYYDCFQNEDYSSFHISSEECGRIDDKFLKREKERMTKVQYAQEYLGEFVDELMQFFSTDLIRSAMTLSSKLIVNKGDRFLGVDVARMGGDETVLFSVRRVDRDRIEELEVDISKNTMLPETVRRIKNADTRFNFKKIYIDDGGLGVGVFDPLLEDDQTKRKVEAINNSSRSIDPDKRRKKILKEDLYTNLLRLLEQNKVALKENPEVLLSLKSIQYEYTDDKRMKIYGNYSHITEALIRAAWCMKNKDLNIYIY
tara:strand:- start:123 stop:1370 length:1248 start_codon:yes stop_codon:yes gene_type:complete